MRVLAIDPGYDRLGIAILDNTNGSDTVLYSTCLVTDRSTDFSERLLIIGDTVDDLIQKYTPDTVAIETLFFNKNIKTAIGVAQARGVIMYLATKAGCTLYEFGPQEIKIAITGYGNSDKTAVLLMVQRLVKNAPTNVLDDEYDAIAVGVTCLAQYGRTR